LTRRLVGTLLARVPVNPQTVFDQPLLGVSLVSAVLADIAPSTWNAAPTDARVQRVVAAIENRPGQPWPDAAMARLAVMSTGGFIRVFSRALGVSPQRYLVRLRIGQASSLLLQTSLSLEAIAERCGFCDRSYFSAVFRRETGMPPARFRAEANRSY
jgi:transcriptional regulator GlxA family with amidase domain